MRNFLIALSLLAGTAYAFDSIACNQTPNVNVSSKAERASFLIYKVDFREDLTRVYIRLIGRPHTSFRIDSVRLSTSAGETYDFTDIEGIDAKRYFQWEDNGQIDAEIDFPAMDRQDIVFLTFYTSDGILKTAGGNPEF